MNMSQITRMFTRLLMRRAMNWGINKGISTFSKARKSRSAQPPVDAAGNPAQVPHRPGAQNRVDTGDLAKKVRTTTRMTRR